MAHTSRPKEEAGAANLFPIQVYKTQQLRQHCEGAQGEFTAALELSLDVLIPMYKPE
jgi:hypothetical protein